MPSPKKKGHQVYSDTEINSTQSAPFDMLVFSHIIEHFAFKDLKKFLDSYLSLLKPGGVILILTPIFQASFYNDFDHVKPYYPIGLQMVYGESAQQVQVQSPHFLILKNIYFIKGQLRLRFFRDLYLKPGGKGLPRIMNMGLKLLFSLSRGLIGEKVSWIGLYQKDLRPKGD